MVGAVNITLYMTGVGVIMIHIRYFARMQDVTGKEEERIPLVSASVQELLEWLKNTYPNFPYDNGSVLVAVNEEYAGPLDEVRDGDIVAVIPPVSGG